MLDKSIKFIWDHADPNTRDGTRLSALALWARFYPLFM